MNIIKCIPTDGNVRGNRAKFPMFMDWPPIKDCKNEDSYGSTCLKCNKCGRFDNLEEDIDEDSISTRTRESKDIGK